MSCMLTANCCVSLRSGWVSRCVVCNGDTLLFVFLSAKSLCVVGMIISCLHWVLALMTFSCWSAVKQLITHLGLISPSRLHCSWFNLRFRSFCIIYNFLLQRFLFTNNARMTSLVGDKFVAGMIGTLCDALEAEYGILIPRLYRIFRPLKGR